MARQKRVRQEKADGPSILVPPFTEPPEPKELKLFDGSGRVVVTKSAGSERWFSEEESRRFGFRKLRDSVVAVPDVEDVRAKANEVQRRLAYRDWMNAVDFFSIMDDTLAVVKYLEGHRVGIPEADRMKCERMGFDEHLFPLVKREFDGGVEAVSEKSGFRMFLREHNLKDDGSYGKFISMAYPRSSDPKLVRNTHLFFFAETAGPLLEIVKKSKEPDRTLENFKRIVDQVPQDARPALFIILGEHPKALERLSGIDWHDQEGLGEFFGRIIANRAAFDGLVKP